jgi:hypothetical protein
MDPWLESPVLWPGVHQRLITYLADDLQPLLDRRYVAAVEERVYIAAADRTIIPDVAIHQGVDHGGGAANARLQPDEAVVVELVEDEVTESFVKIIDLQSQEEVVTVIEILSPSNKETGEGRGLYLAKQQEIMASSANLVEIDLLRGGPHIAVVPEADVLRSGHFDYLVAVSRAKDRDKRSYFYPRTIRDRLPRVAIPLRAGDDDVTLDLQPLVDRIFEAGHYADRINYDQPCIPRLRPDDHSWAEQRIREWKAG